MVLAPGAVAREQMVALGRDLIVRGEAQSDIAALNGDIDVSGVVRGDVVVLGGDVRLAPTARVDGQVFVLGGVVEAGAGAQIGGKSVAYPSISHAWVTLLEAPSLGLEPMSPLVLATKLALLTAWVALMLGCFAAAGRQVLSTSIGVQREPFRNFYIGLVGVLTFVLTGIFLSSFAGALVALPMLVLVVLWLLLLKLWGMVAVFHALGDWCGHHVLRRRLRPLEASTLGLLLLGACKFIPEVGTWIWTVAALIGIGATLSTKFGRREPWFDLDVLERPAVVG